MVITKEKIYNTEEIMSAILKENPKYRSSSSLYSKIAYSEKDGEIVRIGRGKYVYGSLNSFSYDLEGAKAKALYKHLKENYSSNFEFAIYETKVVLNQFLNHLLAHNTIILEVPKIFMEHVFESLKEAGFKNVLFNPSEADFYRYFEAEAIIIKQLISKSPLIKKESKISIEKFCIDVISDKVLNYFYEGAEIPYILEDVFQNYNIRYDTLKNYAKRRNAYNKIIKYVPKNRRDWLNDR